MLHLALAGLLHSQQCPLRFFFLPCVAGQGWFAPYSLLVGQQHIVDSTPTPAPALVCGRALVLLFTLVPLRLLVLLVFVAMAASVVWLLSW
jgi:hypothetical protein